MAMLESLHPLLFLLPPEAAHTLAFKVGKLLQSAKSYAQFEKDFEAFQKYKTIDLVGLPLAHPIGLAAGFDKNAELITLLSNLGFSFIEVGTITPKAQEGNPKPRLFRLKEKKSLINRMGFNNYGMDVAASNIQSQFSTMRNGVKLGINIGKNKITSNDLAHEDYKLALNRLESYADYVVINISSPNTPGLRELQSVAFLEKLKRVLNTTKPIFVKLAPELDDAELKDVVQGVEALGYHGLILTNTLSVASDASLLKQYQSGGISGSLLRVSSREMLLKTKRLTTLPLISVGGIDSGDEILWRLERGATAVQIYTSLIYQGHKVVFKLLREIYGN